MKRQDLTPIRVPLFRVSGQLGKAELDKAQAKCEKLIKSVGSINILSVLEDFTGWKRAEGWEETSFADRNDPYIEKIAIVCDTKWRDHVHLFCLFGHRGVPIKYFDSDQETTARLWLDIP